MIKEDYVNLEVAKLLKEKGFDVKCEYCYAEFSKDNIEVIGLSPAKCAQSLKEDRYPYVTLQMAMKWLREVHKIHIQVEAIVPEYYKKDEYVYRFHYKRLKHVPIYNNMSYIDDTQYVSCEQACEAAIKYCLENLI